MARKRVTKKQVLKLLERNTLGGWAHDRLNPPSLSTVIDQARDIIDRPNRYTKLSVEFLRGDTMVLLDITIRLMKAVLLADELVKTPAPRGSKLMAGIERQFKVSIIKDLMGSM